MKNHSRLHFALERIALNGRWGPDELATLRKLVKDLDHGLKVKNLKTVEKAVDQLSKLVLKNA